MEKRLLSKLLPERYHIFNLVMRSIKKKVIVCIWIVTKLPKSFTNYTKCCDAIFFLKETYILLNFYTYYIRVLPGK